MSRNEKLKYETNRGSVFLAIVEAADGADEIYGVQSGKEVTENLTVRVSKNRRQAGVKPRVAVLSRPVGNRLADTNGLVDGALVYKHLAVLTQAHFGQLQVGNTATIAGTEYTIAALREELIN